LVLVSDGWVLGQEQTVTNVIPIKPEPTNAGPFRTIRELHAVYARIAQVTDTTVAVETRLGSTLLSVDPATASIAAANRHMSAAADQILEAIAHLIVEATAKAVAPMGLHQDPRD
jgi:hypothetical protein